MARFNFKRGDGVEQPARLVIEEPKDAPPSVRQAGGGKAEAELRRRPGRGRPAAASHP